MLELVTSASNWLRMQNDAVVSSRATTSFGYSQYGELTAIAAPGDSLSEPTTRYTYLLQSPVSRVVEQTRSQADGPFDLESVQCFDGRGTTYRPLETLVYDPIDNEPASPHFSTLRRSRVDGLGRTVAISRIVDAAEPEVTITVTYDALGRLPGLSDGLGYTKTQSYDLANRITEERDPDRGVCTYAYDDTDNLLTRTDARGGVTEWSYDAASRPHDRDHAPHRAGYRWSPRSSTTWLTHRAPHPPTPSTPTTPPTVSSKPISSGDDGSSRRSLPTKGA